MKTFHDLRVGGDIYFEQIKNCYKENFGLYHDHGLGTFQNISRTEIVKKKTQPAEVFKDDGLSVTIECNLKSVDFLDVTFYLVNNIYKPYHKPNNLKLLRRLLTNQKVTENF